MGDLDHKPQDCSDVDDPIQRPALYIEVQASYTYEPIFPGLTLAQSFPKTIVKSAWMRVL